MEETLAAKQEEPSAMAVSSDTTNKNDEALNGSHSPTVDGEALAENDLLGFAMPPNNTNTSTGALIMGGTESAAASDDFRTPQETLASSTDLLDFASAPTSMSTSPEMEEKANAETEDLLGFSAQAQRGNEAITDQTQQVTNADDSTNLLDFMSAPVPEQSGNVEDSNVGDEVKDAQDSNASSSQPPQVLLDVFSSESAPSDPASLNVAEEQLVDVSTTEQVTCDVRTDGQGLLDVFSTVTESNQVESDTLLDELSSEQATQETVDDAGTIQTDTATSEQEPNVVEIEATEQVDTNTKDAAPDATVAHAPLEAPSPEVESVNAIPPTESVDADTKVEASESETPTQAIAEANTVDVTSPTESAVEKALVDAEPTSDTDGNEQPVLANDNAAPGGDSESLEDVSENDGDAATGNDDILHKDEDEGMAEIELDTVVQVQSPALVAPSEPTVLSESVTKQVQQVDPWQTDDVAINNESESTVPSNGESKAQSSSAEPSAPKSQPSATMVNLPPSGSSDQESTSAEKDALLVELQSSLQDHMTRQAEAEDRARKAEARMKKLEEELKAKEKAEADLAAMKERLKSVVSDKAHLELELAKLRTARDEHERKEIVLSNRLNAAKKKEAVKADLAERLEDEVKELRAELDATKEKLANSEGTGQKAEQDLKETTRQMTERVRLAETALADERRLNEDRKKKMKAFIESKQEEVRQGKIQVDELNAELDQTNRLLREQNSRWKQLHAQWVQSQTRNRELQRDLNRIKKDSESMHKMGGKMEMKLDKAAQQTEEHKNKRLTAKHELMTILRTLEGEREVSSRLRDSLKFTFTPKALSQQQLLKESLKDFDAELQKLSRRLGRPLPPSIDSPGLFSDNDETDEPVAITPPESDGSAEEGKDAALNRSEIDSNHLISNLETETQRVSQCIMALTSSIERMHVVLDESGPNTCINALTTILMGGAPPQTGGSSSQDERSSLQYGQVPTS